MRQPVKNSSEKLPPHPPLLPPPAPIPHSPVPRDPWAGVFILYLSRPLSLHHSFCVYKKYILSLGAWTKLANFSVTRFFNFKVLFMNPLLPGLWLSQYSVISISSKIREDIHSSRCPVGINHNSSKLTTGVVDTSGKLTPAPAVKSFPWFTSIAVTPEANLPPLSTRRQ